MTGVKGPSAQPKSVYAFIFLALQWGIVMVHTSQGKNHSKYQDLKILEDPVPLRLFAFEGGATEPLSAHFTVCKMAVRVLYQAF